MRKHYHIQSHLTCGKIDARRTAFFEIWDFGIWNLFGIWDFGIWDFPPQAG